MIIIDIIMINANYRGLAGLIVSSMLGPAGFSEEFSDNPKTTIINCLLDDFVHKTEISFV